MSLFYKALEPLTKRRREEYENQKAVYLDRIKSIRQDAENKEIAKEKIEALRKPILRQIIVNDTTVEAVCKVIDEKKPECVCLWRDEFTGFIKGLERYNKSDKTLFLEGYNGNPYTINRVKNDEPKQIPKLSISLLGGIQPDKLRPILKSGDDGFVSRFVFVFSEPQPLERQKFSIDEELFKNLFDRLDALLESTITLSSEALETLDEWIKENDAEKRYASGLIESSYGKFHGQLIRIACVLEHIFWAAKESESSPPTEISNDALESSIDLIEDYFKPMAKKIFCDGLHFVF
jgi:putative DNA primase/helicase